MRICCFLNQLLTTYSFFIVVGIWFVSRINLQGTFKVNARIRYLPMLRTVADFRSRFCSIIMLIISVILDRVFIYLKLVLVFKSWIRLDPSLATISYVWTGANWHLSNQYSALLSKCSWFPIRSLYVWWYLQSVWFWLSLHDFCKWNRHQISYWFAGFVQVNIFWRHSCFNQLRRLDSWYFLF